MYKTTSPLSVHLHGHPPDHSTQWKARKQIPLDKSKHVSSMLKHACSITPLIKCTINCFVNKRIAGATERRLATGSCLRAKEGEKRCAM